MAIIETDEETVGRAAKEESREEVIDTAWSSFSLEAKMRAPEGQMMLDYADNF